VTLTIREALRVEWGDCDPLGIMFYPNCFRWFDTATHHLFDAAGLPMSGLEKGFGIVGCPLVDAGASFKTPLPWMTPIEVETSVAEWRNKSFVMRHLVWKGTELAIEGREIRVCVARHPDDPTRLRGIEIPAALKARFEGSGG
jgi:4-hydroxybenzoyl-CoA thioesterase